MTADERGPFELGSLVEQAQRLIDLGIPGSAAGAPSAEQLMAAAGDLEGRAPAASLLVVSEALVPPSVLAPFMTLAGTVTDSVEGPGAGPRGFVVEDIVDVDSFAPTGVTMPDAPVYALADPARGDDMRNWSPAEALDAIAGRDREPMTLAEGIHWVLQSPQVLSRNTCFMTIASRLPKKKPTKADAFDSRTPALWISNGTGRDGAHRRNAPKVGWCWWNNRHTWLGFGSTGGRFA